MTATDVTTYRDAVRRRIAQIAAGIIGAAIAVLLLAISSIPVDPRSEFDTAGGTRSYPDLGTIGLLISVSALTIPIASAIGTTFGRGPAADSAASCSRWWRCTCTRSSPEPGRT